MRRRQRRSRLLVGLSMVPGLVLLTLLPVTGCSPAADPWDGETGSPRVVVTMAPLYSFVRAVGGDRVAIRCLCTTTGPHHFQAESRDARLFEKADVVFAVGLQLDAKFALELRSLARRPDLPLIKVGEQLPESDLLKSRLDAHRHGVWDPHVWLGIAQAEAIVGKIADRLADIDAANAGEYRKNAGAFVGRLKKLEEDGRKMLADKKVKRLVTFHESLGYFARSFGLDIAGVIELSPGDEPSPEQLARIIDLCGDAKNPVGAITVEPQYPKTSSAATIHRELSSKRINVPLIEVDPLETASLGDLEKEKGSWYETRMRKNLQTLAGALK